MAEARIIAEGLIFRYGRGLRLGPVDLSLGAGLHHLRGPNGAGKTTLLRCLCGSLRGFGGMVRVAGGDPSRDHRVRAHIGFLPGRHQVPTFLRVDEAWQILAALRGVPAWEGRPLREALDLPGDLRLSHASDGQRRKTEILCCLAGDPAILLLDEPLALLDPAAVRTLAGWLDGWRKTRVILTTSHETLPTPPDSAADLEPGGPLAWKNP